VEEGGAWPAGDAGGAMEGDAYADNHVTRHLLAILPGNVVALHCPTLRRPYGSVPPTSSYAFAAALALLHLYAFSLC